MRTVQLSVTVPATLDASGNGAAQAGPTGFGEIWLARYTIGVRVATNTAEAIASAWAGSGPPAGFLGATTWGSTGDANSDTPQLNTGQAVTVQWAGGDPHATAYLTITGTRQVP